MGVVGSLTIYFSFSSSFASEPVVFTLTSLDKLLFVLLFPGSYELTMRDELFTSDLSIGSNFFGFEFLRTISGLLLSAFFGVSRV